MEIQFPQTIGMRVVGNKNAMNASVTDKKTPWGVESSKDDKKEIEAKLAKQAMKALRAREKNKAHVEEMKGEKDEAVNNFFKKFGILKKASVLLQYNRINDSWDEICKAAQIMQKQKELDQEKQRKLESDWQAKLSISSIETPIPIDKITAKDLTPAFLKELTKDGGNEPATVKLYL